MKQQQQKEWKMTIFNWCCWEIQVGVWTHLKDLGKLPDGIIYISFISVSLKYMEFEMLYVLHYIRK